VSPHRISPRRCSALTTEHSTLGRPQTRFISHPDNRHAPQASPCGAVRTRPRERGYAARDRGGEGRVLGPALAAACGECDFLPCACEGEVMGEEVAVGAGAAPCVVRSGKRILVAGAAVRVNMRPETKAEEKSVSVENTARAWVPDVGNGKGGRVAHGRGFRMARGRGWRGAGEWRWHARQRRARFAAGHALDYSTTSPACKGRGDFLRTAPDGAARRWTGIRWQSHSVLVWACARAERLRLRLRIRQRRAPCLPWDLRTSASCPLPLAASSSAGPPHIISGPRPDLDEPHTIDLP
jgi:hypothetical protein